MKHVRPISVAAMPVPAISLLEKQAMTELFERTATQLAVLLNLLHDIKMCAEES